MLQAITAALGTGTRRPRCFGLDNGPEDTSRASGNTAFVDSLFIHVHYKTVATTLLSNFFSLDGFLLGSTFVGVGLSAAQGVVNYLRVGVFLGSLAFSCFVVSVLLLSIADRNAACIIRSTDPRLGHSFELPSGLELLTTRAGELPRLVSIVQRWRLLFHLSLRLGIVFTVLGVALQMSLLAVIAQFKIGQAAHGDGLSIAALVVLVLTGVLLLLYVVVAPPWGPSIVWRGDVITHAPDI